MPITTEEEPEDLDDDAPSRVRRLCHFICGQAQAVSSLLYALLTAFRLTYPQHKFSPLSALLSLNISHLLTLRIAVAPSSPWVYALKGAVST